MSREQYQEDCPGCRPAMIDLKTGKRMSDDTPVMMAVNRVYAAASRAEKEAFHRVCCLNSRALDDLQLMAQLQQRIQRALEALGN